MSYSFMQMREIPDPAAKSVATQHTLETKAAITTAEAGEFTAYASSFGNVDRMGERVVKGAFAETIRRWRRAGRDVPLVWDHATGAHDVIGSIDSSTMEERDAGLFVEGTLDIEDSELAREAWRSVKRNRISLSFGYLVEEEREGTDGVKELTKIDLMEVTLTAVPANPDARVLSSKSAGDVTFEQLRADRAKRIDTRPLQVASFEC